VAGLWQAAAWLGAGARPVACRASGALTVGLAAWRPAGARSVPAGRRHPAWLPPSSLVPCTASWWSCNGTTKGSHSIYAGSSASQHSESARRATEASDLTERAASQPRTTTERAYGASQQSELTEQANRGCSELTERASGASQGSEPAERVTAERVRGACQPSCAMERANGASQRSEPTERARSARSRSTGSDRFRTRSRTCSRFHGSSCVSITEAGP